MSMASPARSGECWTRSAMFQARASKTIDLRQSGAEFFAASFRFSAALLTSRLGMDAESGWQRGETKIAAADISWVASSVELTPKPAPDAAEAGESAATRAGMAPAVSFNFKCLSFRMRGGAVSFAPRAETHPAVRAAPRCWRRAWRSRRRGRVRRNARKDRSRIRPPPADETRGSNGPTRRLPRHRAKLQAWGGCSAQPRA